MAARHATASPPLLKEDESEADPQEEFRGRLAAIVGSLETKAKDRVNARASVEARWIEDLRQVHGRYSRRQESDIGKIKGSTAFVNITRPKTNALEARLTDLLFPTDDRNWGIGPTPVPELSHGADAAIREVEAAKKQMEAADVAGQQAAQTNDFAGKVGANVAYDAAAKKLASAQEAQENLQAVLDEARDRADLMQEEMDDQLKASRYGAQCREVIRDACRLGTGVMKGPVIGKRRSDRWRKGPDNVYVLQAADEVERPEYVRVDPWNFFPDAVKRVEDGEGVFERHPMTPTQFRKWVKSRSDIDADIARKLLTAGPQETGSPQFMIDLFDVTGYSDYKPVPRFWVWEYTGPLDHEHVRDLAHAQGDEGYAAVLADVDPLEELHVRVWFCEGEMLSFAPHPLDSNECLYSVINLEEDEASPFGYGIPYIIRSEQSTLNSAWRMMLDNANLATGPQIVINKDAVEPADGNWTIYPNKVWHQKKSLTGQSERPFWTFDIPMRQTELANIIALARQHVDEVSGISALAQGEQATGVTKTAQGMALLMNASNIVFRRIVKMIDDDLTIPCIRRLYHYNMQFSQKDEIKGDYEVDARGSSVLLVRELQAQNLMVLLQFVDHPVLGPALRKLDLLRETFKALMLSASQFVESDSTYEEILAQNLPPEVRAAQIQQQTEQKKADLEERRLELDASLAEMKADREERLAQLNFDTAMLKLSTETNVSLEQIEAQLSGIRAKEREAERKEQAGDRRLAVEAAMREQTGVSSGGAI